MKSHPTTPVEGRRYRPVTSRNIHKLASDGGMDQDWIAAWGLVSVLRSRRYLALGNMALRQQLMGLQRQKGTEDGRGSIRRSGV